MKMKNYGKGFLDNNNKVDGNFDVVQQQLLNIMLKKTMKLITGSSGVGDSNFW